MSDVAFLAGLDESTVCRLWEDLKWLDRIKGRSLQALISVLPGIAEYAFEYPLANRRSLLADELSEAGLEVNRPSYRKIVRESGVPEQYIGNTLNTAVQIVQSNTREAAAHLARFWGREQDYALSFLFCPVSGEGLLLNSELLLNASIRMVKELDQYANSFHAIIAQATLVHHVAKATGTSLTDFESTILERRTALTYRSAMIGIILQSNDRDMADSYSRTVARNPLLSLVERWAFPTYTHDAKLTPDFSLPPSLLLRNTAKEILWEIDHYNDAYLYYLLEAGIPGVIQHDPTFGLRVQDLAAILQQRLDKCTDSIMRKSCESFLGKIYHNPIGQRGDFLDQPW